MDVAAVKRTALEAALSAGEVLKQGFGRVAHVRTKSSATDLVTEYDGQAQEAILSVLRQRHPEHDVLAEEDFCQQTGSPYRWVIDPLDGTTNFAHGNPLFCVSLGLQHRAEPVLGVVFAPCLDELFVAGRGQGATCNGKPIRTSKVEALERSLLATGFSYRRDVIAQNLEHFGRFALRSQAIRRNGAAALDLCWLAMGRFDGFWELDLNPWDVMAGWLIVQEAGGRVSDFSGGPFDPQGRELLASNGLIHDEMIAVLAAH